ncbi:hypothetical protein [Deinococcus ruber]|uniref:Uncharacterized protein n=1 Tax=Deinococcus ruber TaxID=1848197 RepID=A0A918BZB9_9DEIO|nr:hypothetical protein [Deinococcus ruber]GGQ98192.1 hypothetical protein GCM10008957_08150 [Deinococcus ruber]
MRGLLIAMMVLMNVGGPASLIFSLRQQNWGAAFNTLALLVLLDVLGFWLLNSMREDGPSK